LEVKQDSQNKNKKITSQKRPDQLYFILRSKSFTSVFAIQALRKASLCSLAVGELSALIVTLSVSLVISLRFE